MVNVEPGRVVDPLASVVPPTAVVLAPLVPPPVVCPSVAPDVVVAWVVVADVLDDTSVGRVSTAEKGYVT